MAKLLMLLIRSLRTNAETNGILLSRGSILALNSASQKHRPHNWSRSTLRIRRVFDIRSATARSGSQVQILKKKWLAYIKNTEIPDNSPPPQPTDLKVDGSTLIWKATADLESGLAHFIILRDGEPLATIPENSRSIQFREAPLSGTPSRVTPRYNRSTQMTFIRSQPPSPV